MRLLFYLAAAAVLSALEFRRAGKLIGLKDL